jgi:hypothetical protein
MPKLLACVLLLAASSPAAAESNTEGLASPLRIASAFGAVTSTYRSVEHNRAVGGVPNSYHLQGRALDIARRSGVTHAQVEVAFRAAGLNLIESLDEGDHSHFAFAPAAVAEERPRQVPAASASKPPKAAAPEQVLVADQHGTLWVDINKTLEVVPDGPSHQLATEDEADSSATPTSPRR